MVGTRRTDLEDYLREFCAICDGKIVRTRDGYTCGCGTLGRRKKLDARDRGGPENHCAPDRALFGVPIELLMPCEARKGAQR